MFKYINSVIICILIFSYAGIAGAACTAGDDTCYGFNAGFLNNGANNNVFFGAYAGEGSSTGKFNAFVGHTAGNFNGTGLNNTFIGKASGLKNTNSSANTFVGSDTGFNNVSGGGNLFLGFQAGYNELGSNRLYIHNSSTPAPLIYGEFDNSLVDINGDLYVNGSLVDINGDLYVNGNMFLTSDVQFKKDITAIDSSLEKILKMRGVSFKWNDARQKKRATSDRKHFGVIAQEMQEVLPEIVNVGKNGVKKVAYMEIIPVLIEAVKEQQMTISGLSEKVMELERELKARNNLTSAYIYSY